MSSGAETLRSIDDALTRAKAQVSELSQKLQVSSAELMKLEQDEASHYRDLARVRVSELAQGDLLGSLDSAERDVSDLLQRREQALQGLQQEQAQLSERREALESQRAEHSRRLEAASDRLDGLEADAQGQLAADAEYQSQLQLSQEAEARSERAERKTELAEADREHKGAPYEADPLFMYLWRRGYGTSAYRANPLTRALDGWVAGLCRFQGARPNYAMLIQLPERLREHTEKVRSDAEQELDKLRALETGVAESVGVVGAREELEAADLALTEADTAIEELDGQSAGLDEKVAAFASGQDPIHREAVDAFVAALRGESLRALMREARQTPTRDDDRIVEELVGSQEHRQALEKPLQQGRGMLAGLNQRVRELEQVRQEFRRRRYDSGSSGFADGAMIGMLLSQFLGGMMNAGDLWGNIEQQQRWQRRRANPGFGSGSLRRGGGVWSGGRPRGGGGFGGGGFRTGGGFGGGGGFKTGGGF